MPWLSEIDENPELGYVRNSDTSLAGALAVAPNASSMRETIADMVKQCPSTCDEIEASTGWKHQTVSARFRELVLADRLYDTGARRNTRSGVPARVYAPLFGVAS